jgi:transitional endoplasmic reticulum ATPase
MTVSPPQPPAAAPSGTLEAILAAASDETREALRTLGELLGNAPTAAPSPTQFASRHLGVDTVGLASTKFNGPGTALALLGSLLGTEMARHAERVVVGSLGEGQPPTWGQLDLGPGEKVSVPSRMVVLFPAGTLTGVPLCIVVDDRHWSREFAILSAAADKPAAEAVLESFRDRLKTGENPLRGRVLEASLCDGSVRLGVAPPIEAQRGGLILPDDVWREIDIFLAAAGHRRELMRRLGLGTSRGLLVAGPPGVGKTHLVRVIAAELAGRFTTILADANSMRHAVAELFAETEAFGPTVVVLDDIDLVLTHRDSSGNNATLADFLAALDGVHQREDILTVATTNDPKSLDPAAQRASRFDVVVTLPPPDAPLRARLLARYLGPLGAGIDPLRVAEVLDGATGADIKEVVRRVVLEHGEAFTEDDLVRVADGGRWKANLVRRRYL